MSKGYRPNEDLQAEPGEVMRMLSGNDIDILGLLDKGVSNLHDVADEVGLTHNSVEKAYKRLEDEGFVNNYSGEGGFDGEISPRGVDALWLSDNILPEDQGRINDVSGSEIRKVVKTGSDRTVFEGGLLYEGDKDFEFEEGSYAFVRPTGEKIVGLSMVEVEEYPLNLED